MISGCLICSAARPAARGEERTIPELPDIESYLAALRPRIQGETIARVRIRSPFVLRTAEPPIADVAGRAVRELSRLGKRIVFEVDGDYFLIVHLMVAGRFRWKAPDAVIPTRIGLAALDVARGTLLLTEVSKKQRASIHLVRGRAALAAHDPGGLEPLSASLAAFAAALTRENHTVKRALTDPRLLSGIGNAYSDEILHAAKLSPLKLTSKLTEEEIERLFEATRATLTRWTTRLIAETGDGFPEKVTAFREGMAVHGRYRKPCPVCGSPVQRIRYADNEANYCATCQTGGRLLADRAMSRLLKDDWPRSLEELEARGMLSDPSKT
jgi:formamidopyrimidine-DNA glycosylase